MSFFGYSRVRLVVTDSNNAIIYDKKVWMRNGAILQDELMKRKELEIKETHHDQYGRYMYSIMGVSDGVATVENRIKFAQYADASFGAQMDASAAGTGNLLFINGGEPVRQNQTSNLLGLSAAKIKVSSNIDVVELKLGVNQNSDMVANAKEAQQQGRQLISCSSNSRVSQENPTGAYNDFYVLKSSLSILNSTVRAVISNLREVSSNIQLFFGSSSFLQLLPRHLVLYSELELARRQRVLEQSAQRRVQKMLLFDAAAPTAKYESPSYFGPTNNFLSDSTPNAIASTPSMPGLNFFGDGVKDWSGGQPPSPDSDFGGSGGERMRSKAKEGNKQQQKSGNPISNPSSSKVSNTNTPTQVSNSNNTSVKAPVSNAVSSAVKNSFSTKTSNPSKAHSKTTNAQEARAKAANNVSNFQMQVPISEGKTQVQNAETVHTPVQNMQNTIAMPSQSLQIESMQTIAQSSQEQQVHQPAAQQEHVAMAARQMQAEAPQQAITQEQAAAHQEQSEAPQQIAHQEQAVQAIVQEPQLQSQPIAAQRIRTQKKKAGEKIIPRIPIAVCANADNGNKEENPMSAINEEKEDNARVAQTVKPVPRRVAPTGIVAFIPLRNLFENKRNKKEKYACPSKVCGWCGRKAA